MPVEVPTQTQTIMVVVETEPMQPEESVVVVASDDAAVDISVRLSKSPDMGTLDVPASVPSADVSDKDAAAPAAIPALAAATVEDIGKLIQDLSSADVAVVNASLDALYLDLEEDSKKCENVVTAGGSHALVLLAKTCLDKAIQKFPESKNVTELDGQELTTLYKALRAIIGLTYQNKMSRIGISAIGGVQVCLSVMTQFPVCQPLQWIACVPVRNLAHCDIGKKKALDANGMEIVLHSLQKHVGSTVVCESALYALVNMIKESKKNTEILIGLGGAAVLVDVKNKWPDNAVVQPPLRRLAKLISEEINSWVVADEE
jgi:hypothetical protein